MHHQAKAYSLLLNFLLLPPLYAATNPNNTVPNCNPTFTSSPTFTNNPTANPTFNASPVFNTEINPQFITNTTSTINAIGMQVRDIALHMIEKAQETFSKKNYNSAKDFIQPLIWQHRYNIAAATLFGAYSSTSMLLLIDYHYLTNSARWSHWKSNYSFERLCTLSQHELAQELLRAIGEQHYNKKNPTDLSHPLITFIATIEDEIKTCKRYVNIAKTIKRLHVITIFPTNNTKIDEVSIFLERALFIRHIFLSWLAERNLTTKSLKKGHAQALLSKSN